MKTYNEYLKEIKDREWAEGEPERLRQSERHKAHGGDYPCVCFSVSGNVGKMTVDYSVEIMGMMMQDFLEEAKGIAPFQFDENGNLRVTERL